LAWIFGLTLLFRGWRLDPILQFVQLIMVGLFIVLDYESFRIREFLKEQELLYKKVFPKNATDENCFNEV